MSIKSIPLVVNMHRRTRRRGGTTRRRVGTTRRRVGTTRRRGGTTRRRGGAINDALNAEGKTALYKAVESNNLSKTEELITAGADINKATNTGTTPLIIASISGYLEIIERLIAAGAYINKSHNDGSTPLYVASYYSHLEIVDKLIAEGADINKSHNDGATPLYVASYHGHLEVVDKLIAAGADINKANKNGATPLYVASQNGHLEVVDKLIAGTDINKANKDGATPLYIASRLGHLEVVERLIAAGADINKANNDDVTPLCIASQNGHLEIVDKLIAAGADINKANYDNKTPLYVAIANGHLEVVKRLIAAGADVNKANNEGRTPLYVASIYGKLEIVKRLLEVPEIDFTTVKRDISRFSSEIQKIINDYINKSHINKSQLATLWPGFSKADSKNLRLLFEEKIHSNTLAKNPDGAREVLFSHCPICLKYISHEEATCMYMSHNCTEHGGFYYKKLFDKYKHGKINAAGIETGNEVISWCTLCGRICKGHQHYKLDSYDVENPTLLEVEAPAPYETDCRKTNGGGGWPEKAARHRRLREYALELNDQVGQITTQEALEHLVEEMWNAPLRREGRILTKMEVEKKYNSRHKVFPNIPSYTRFPNLPNNNAFEKAELTNTTFKVGSQTFQIKNDELYKNNTTKAEAPYQYFYQQFKKGAQPVPNIAYPNNANPELKPIVHPVAPNGYIDLINPTLPDKENIVQFRHRMADGTINNHSNPETDMIAKDYLFLKILSAFNHGELSKIGPCWKPGCTAIIYPQELKAIIDAADYPGEAKAAGAAKKEDMKVYEQYRHEFNKKYK